MRKIRFALLLACVVLTAAGASAQLLWKISGGNLSRPSYVFGTFHFASGDMLDSIKGFNDALASCDAVLGEVEKDSLLSPRAQKLMTAAMMAPADSTLDKLYSPEGYAIVARVWDKYFGEMGVKLSQMNMLKPAAISTQLQALQALQYLKGFNANNLIDGAAQQRGNALGKPSGGLETVEEQINMLFNSPINDQAADLLEACKNDNTFQDLSQQLIDAYDAQDLDKLLAIMSDPSVGGDDSAEMERLVYSRNRRWAERLAQMMPERSLMVCVGAGHLPGEQGLLQLLRARGFTVEPM